MPTVNDSSTIGVGILTDSLAAWQTNKFKESSTNDIMINQILNIETFDDMNTNNSSYSNSIDEVNNNPSNITLKPITNKMKNKKRIKKNVTVLKESTSETVFVNYTVEDKKKQKTKPTISILESNGSTVTDCSTTTKSVIEVPDHDKNSMSEKLKMYGSLQSNSITYNIDNRKAESTPLKDNLASSQNKINNIYPQHIIIPSKNENIDKFDSIKQDENDASMDFNKIISRDISARVITPTTTRFYISSSSSMPSSPAICTPSAAYYGGNPCNKSSQRPMSAVTAKYPKNVLYNGMSPYARRTGSNKNSVYKSLKETGSVSTSTLSSAIESTFDLSLSGTLQKGQSYLDDFNDLLTSPADIEADSSFSSAQQNSSDPTQSYIMRSQQSIDPESTVYLPQEYSERYSDILEMDLISAVGVDNTHNKNQQPYAKHAYAGSETTLPGSISGCTLANQQSVNDFGTNRSGSVLQNVYHIDSNTDIGEDITDKKAENNCEYSNLDFTSIDAMFPVANEISTSKQGPFDDVFSILK